MVVEYQTAAEGSWLSFFTVTPKILLKQRGSIIPKVIPQMALAIGCAVVARWWNPLSALARDVQEGLSMMGYLLSFLLVFKTHSAYQQFWTAYTMTGKLLQSSRDLAMAACAAFPDDGPAARGRRRSRCLPGEDPWAGAALPGAACEGELAAGGPAPGPDGAEAGEELQLRRLLQRLRLEACLPRLRAAGFGGLAALRCSEEPDLAEAGLRPGERAVLREWLRRERRGAEAGAPGAPGAPAAAEPAPAHRYLRRLCRLVALHYYVVVEYFRRTGQDSTASRAVQDRLRHCIEMLTFDQEYGMIYPNEARGTPGSQAPNTHANPMVVRYWMQLTIGAGAAAHKIPPPIVASFTPKMAELSDAFLQMDQIDKLQFPLPYAQVVKVLMLIFVVLIPWVLQPVCQDLTELVVALISMGLFGLDEVAEIMESPFGNDANHIDLEVFGQDLLDDLELVYNSRQRQLDSVLAEPPLAPSQRLFDNRLRSVCSSSLLTPDAHQGWMERAMRQEMSLRSLQALDSVAPEPQGQQGGGVGPPKDATVVDP